MLRNNNNDSSRKRGQQSSGKKQNDCILLLHGNKQTGQLLAGRLEKLRKRILREFQIDMLAPDAPFPHPENANLRTWWNRNDNDYEGLDESLKTVQEEMSKGNIVGMIGFSQGARLTHLLAMLHTSDPVNWFPSLKFLIIVAGYDAPIPDHFPLQRNQRIDVSSLHVWGLADPLISPERSEAVVKDYSSPLMHVHAGKHYVPLKSPDLQAYMDFIRQSTSKDSFNLPTGTDNTKVTASASDDKAPTVPQIPQIPDQESALMQQDEVQALEAIFPEEVLLRSAVSEVDGEPVYDHPIRYEVRLIPTDPDDTNTNWPVHPLTLQVTYAHNYPTDAIPSFKLLHENNITQFPRCRLEKFSAILEETAEMEIGMPSVLSCIYATKEYLDSPQDDTEVDNSMVGDIEPNSTTEEFTPANETTAEQVATDVQGTIKRSSAEQITTCTLEGLEIAEQLLLKTPQQSSSSDPSGITGKGGSFWTYTIGLVGKPSAGKSTFFNAASAFSRQRGDKEGDPEWGGASMAAHPFTTIDPNVGYCLVPAPEGSCPEDSIVGSKEGFGSIHGRDAYGRRFLPVLLKDVAGLVPGAYQGRGRGNQFLNDLTDATVLIHVVDASGTADAQGNTTVTGDEDGDLTNPLDDLAWIRAELVEWVYSNLMQKWSSIERKGQSKLSGMFSGYGQNQAMTQSIFVALDKYLEANYGRDRALDDIGSWDQADVHRLVSAFLGVRFPMALALNKLDLPSSRKNAKDIQAALPIHGAHAGTPLEARSEMAFVRNHLSMKASEKIEGQPPVGVWQCLRSAMMLREPVLVFPVADMTTYAPLPGMNKNSAEHPSLPSQGMIGCIRAAGGSVPSCWQDDSYAVPSKDKAAAMKLRDVLLMKPGSTVDDVFQTLKKYGALGGEFVRAESAGNIGDKAKPVPKHAVVGRESRILKIMSNKRTAWQS